MTLKTWYSLDLCRILTTRSFLPTLQKTPGLCRDWGSSRGALGVMAIFSPRKWRNVNVKRDHFKRKTSSSNQHFFRICEFFGGVLAVFVFFYCHLMACDDMWFFAMQESGQSTLAHASVASTIDGFLIPRCAFLVYTLQKKNCVYYVYKIQCTIYKRYVYVIVFPIPHPSLSLCIFSRLRFEYLSDTFQVISTQHSPKML